MKNIIIRGIDPALDKKIRANAVEQKKSVNQWILSALRRLTGISKDKTLQTYNDLDALAGGWDEASTREFNRNTAIFQQVDEELFR